LVWSLFKRVLAEEVLGWLLDFFSLFFFTLVVFVKSDLDHVVVTSPEELLNLLDFLLVVVGGIQLLEVDLGNRNLILDDLWLKVLIELLLKV